MGWRELLGTHIMHKHRLNAIPQSNRARVASPASTSQLQHDDSVLESSEFNITAIFLDCRPDSRLQELLDHAHDFIILFVVSQRVLLAALLRILSTLRHGADNRFPGGHGLSDETKNFRLDVRPIGVACLGHCDEVGSKEYRLNAIDIK